VYHRAVVRRFLLAALLAASADRLRAAPHPALVADLPDEVLVKVTRAAASSPAATLDAVFAAVEPYVFQARGVRAYTDTRWFQATSVEGDGAPVLELRRWPGDTVIAFYELPPDGAPGSGIPAGMKVGAKRPDAGTWSCSDARLEAKRGDYGAIWCETRPGTTRRVGALGIPSDAGLGETAVPDLRESIFGVLRKATVKDGEGGPVAPPLVPQLYEPPVAADESRQGWGSFAGADYSLGLPPGLRAIRLDAGVPAPRPMPAAVAWLRGRFVDRDEKPVVVGDGTHAGYFSILGSPPETWTAGVAPPLGAPSAERLDEARLDDTVREWTGASRAVVSHWKEEGFAGDWLVFRLLVAGRGIEIGLPVVSGWRSAALFWIPVTYRGADHAPAPPPIDPAIALGVKFSRLTPGQLKQNGLIEGRLVASDLLVEVPRGWWPVANLGARDGFPVTFVDAAGKNIGAIVRLPAGSPELTPKPEDGWQAVPKPGSQRASAIWTQSDGRAVLVAKDGHGYLFLPGEDSPSRRDGWRRLRESADFIKTARR